MAVTGSPKVMLVCEGLDLAGGVERFACTLANHLVGQGLQVTLASVATPRERLHYGVLPQVQVLHAEVDVNLPIATDATGGLQRRLVLLRRQWRIGRALVQLVRRERPDVLVLNGLTTACSLLGLAPHLAPRAICCDHNHFGARSRPWRWMRGLLYPRAAAVVSLTEADRPRFAAVNARTEVITNASSLSAEAPVPVAAPLVLAVGRHVAQKGLDLLLQAWVVVVARLPQARLQIVGEGPLKPVLQQQAQALGVAHSVTWFPPTGDMQAHYRRAAVFVLPSRYEGMPLALLEAQALGVSAVAFDCPTGPREIVSVDTGIVVPALDTAALADALLLLLTHPELRNAMAHAAIARSRALFSPELHLARWTALIQRVAATVGSHR